MKSLDLVGPLFRMEVLDEILTKLKDLRRDFKDGTIAREIIEENEQAIVEKNQNQLSEGVRSDGSEIKPEYSPLTKRIKRSKGQPDDRVTLFDKGPFYKGIDVDVFADKFELIGEDPKTKKLQTKYGPLILGVGEQGKQELVDEVFRPAAIDKARERLDLVA